jgi:hypothetical protein
LKSGGYPGLHGNLAQNKNTNKKKNVLSLDNFTGLILPKKKKKKKKKTVISKMLPVQFFTENKLEGPLPTHPYEDS